MHIILVSISKQNIEILQLIKNPAARLLMSTKRSYHITPIHAAIHWLPVSYRIDFKILLLVFKALSGRTSVYLYTWLTNPLSVWTLSDILQQGPINSSKISTGH